MKVFARKFIKPFFPEEALRESKYVQTDYKLLIHFHVISLFSTGFFFIYCQLMGMTNTSYGVLLSFISSIVGLVLLKKYNLYRFVSHLFTFFFFVTFYIANIYAGMGVNPAMVWFILFPLIPVSLLGIKEGVVWTITSSLAIILTSILFKTYEIDFNEFNEELAFHSAMTNMFFGPLIVFALSSFAYKNKDEAIEDLEQINVDLEKLNREKQYLLSVLFHDLSNSVHVALNFSDPIFSDAMNEDRLRKNMERIQAVSKNMDRLIGHVKELQAIESGKKKIELTNVELSNVFRQLRVFFEQKLQEKNLTLEVHSEIDDLCVQAEEVSFSNSVINNLISNAIKFSPENETINIWVRNFDDQVEIRVEDFGDGIDEELLPNLFDFNKPTSHKGTKGEEGTGFGLPTAKKYIDMYNGTISYDYAYPEEKKGSQFKLVIPKAS
jgi:signal transduction histidine kinase